MPAKIFKNLFTIKEIHEIVKFYESQPISIIDQRGNINRNLDYHLPNSFAFNKIKPKLDKCFGEHYFSSGSYEECVVPYSIGVNTRNQHVKDKNCFVFNKNIIKHNIGILIPLVEGPEFKSVMFDYYTDEELSEENLKNNLDCIYQNNLNIEDWNHISDPYKKYIKHFKIDLEYNWKLGDILTWPRNQLHSGTNFLKFKVTKKYIAIFLS